jgi:AraC family transcriptional regulator
MTPGSGAAPASPRTIARGAWPGVGFFSATQDIRSGADWKIRRSADTVVVHLAGPITLLETELEGAGAVHDPPMAGEVWVIPSGSPYHTRAKGGRVHYAELHFDSGAVEGLRQGAPVRARAGHFDGFLQRATERLEDLCSRPGDLAAMAAQSLSHAMLLHFYSSYYGESQTAVANAPSGPVRLRSAETALLLDFIDAHLASPLRLETLAALVQLTVHEFLIAFRASFGTTPAQYVIGRRLRRARWLLLHTSRSLAEIAFDTGFSSHAHLTNTFRARLRTTPRDFRLTQRGH